MYESSLYEFKGELWLFYGHIATLQRGYLGHKQNFAILWPVHGTDGVLKATSHH